MGNCCIKLNYVSLYSRSMAGCCFFLRVRNLTDALSVCGNLYFVSLDLRCITLNWDIIISIPILKDSYQTKRPSVFNLIVNTVVECAIYTPFLRKWRNTVTNRVLRNPPGQNEQGFTPTSTTAVRTQSALSPCVINPFMILEYLFMVLLLIHLHPCSLTVLLPPFPILSLGEDVYCNVLRWKHAWISKA
jgi:hypothetical protein